MSSKTRRTARPWYYNKWEEKRLPSQICVVGSKRKGQGGGGVLLWGGRKVPALEPTAGALTWGLSPESGRKEPGEAPDSVFT